MVPVRLDALLLASDEPVAGPAADFSRLPWRDAARDVNPDRANLADEIVSHPFDDQTLFLKPGVHLHWALPDALTHATHAAGVTVFPRVPNRWLVVRSRGAAHTVEWTRVVESDFLWPEGVDGDPGGVTVPVAPGAGEHRPWRHLGRSVSLAAWAATPPAGAEYLDRLTAIGYGEMGFASLYPNCRGVFGLHDPLPADEAGGVRYDLLGWYSSAAHDPLWTLVQGYTVPEGAGTRAPTVAELREKVKAELGWEAPAGGAEFPDRVVCYARLEFAADAQPVEDAATLGDVEVALAGTGVEALSAWLASKESASGGDKRAVEDALEALQLLPRLRHRALDVGANLREGRHERGFAARPGGTAWTLRPAGEPSAADAGQEQARRGVALPAELAARLATVNALQEEYDDACDAVEAAREQVFADWYRAMLCAYPPPEAVDDFPDLDRVRHFIRTRSLAELTAALAAAGTLTVTRSGDGALAGAAVGPAEPAGSLAARLATELTALTAGVAQFNGSAEAVAAGAAYEVHDAPRSRWWEAREPVVLLTGRPLRSSDRHGDDGVLACGVFDGAGPAELFPARVGDVRTKIDTLQAAGSAGGFGFRAWTAQPWHPLALEWEAELLPLTPGGNGDPDDPRYAADHLTASFTLPEGEPDLAVRDGRCITGRTATLYTGRTPLTAAAGELLAARIQDYLADPATDADSVAAGHLRTALGRLTAAGFYALSQSLGGFNQALLMRRRTRQLEIADPLGFLADVGFASEVREAVAGRTRSAPQPLWDFNPIRTGALRLRRLRLVDSFGRGRELDVSRVVTTELLRTAEDPSLVWLPPRLATPARLDFRWLPAAGGDGSPVCGWFIPDLLDGSLLVYAAGGAALGLIDAAGHWQAPGVGMAATPADIGDPELRRAVTWLIGKGAGFLDAFVDAVEAALESIDPESYAQHPALALLIGRPVALARATLAVQVQGALPVHQGWSHFRHDLERTTRGTDDLERVRLPLRVGEHGQLGDGVVGYWVQQADGTYRDGTFFASHGGDSARADLRTTAADPAPLTHALGEPALTLALLLDPRGVVHATSGIVPARELAVPHEQYAPALAALEAVFLTTPLVTDAGVLRLPLPAEPGFRWTWLGDEDAPLERPAPAASFAPQAVREGWLRLTPDP